MSTVRSGARNYSPIRHIAYAIWLNHDPRRCYMAMFTAYYDASGTEREADQPLVVVGLLSTVERWRKFEREWDAVLAKYGAAYLHMKEFTCFKGPFESWRGDEKRRGTFLSLLVRVLRKRLKRAFCVRITPTDFDAISRRYVLPQSLFPSAYPFLALKCTGFVEGWFASSGIRDPVHHVIEQGDIGQGAVVNLANRLPGMGITVLPKQDAATGRRIAPFQAADLVAYEIRTAVKRHIEGSERPMRLSAIHVLGTLPFSTHEFGEKDLAEMCEAQPNRYPRREGI